MSPSSNQLTRFDFIGNPKQSCVCGLSPNDPPVPPFSGTAIICNRKIKTINKATVIAKYFNSRLYTITKITVYFPPERLSNKYLRGGNSSEATFQTISSSTPKYSWISLSLMPAILFHGISEC